MWSFGPLVTSMLRSVGPDNSEGESERGLGQNVPEARPTPLPTYEAWSKLFQKSLLTLEYGFHRTAIVPQLQRRSQRLRSDQTPEVLRFCSPCSSYMSLELYMMRANAYVLLCLATVRKTAHLVSDG